jgi:hypothetical protein
VYTQRVKSWPASGEAGGACKCTSYSGDSGRQELSTLRQVSFASMVSGFLLGSTAGGSSGTAGCSMAVSVISFAGLRSLNFLAV